MSISQFWKRTILSDEEHEHLVAEVSYGEQFVFLLDREDGRGAVCVSFPIKQDGTMVRIPLSEFIGQLNAAESDLCR